MKRYVVPILGRAGLGNELFPILRAVDVAHREARSVIWPTWIQFKVGPFLRRERDKRMYWLLFRGPGLVGSLRRLRVRAMRNSLSANSPAQKYATTQGMAGYFDGVKISGNDFRDILRAHARKGAVSERLPHPYVAMHVRLGDFSRGESSVSVMNNNTSSPIEWFVTQANSVRQRHPKLRVYVCSDGSDDELRSLLEVNGVRRSSARNALDDLFFLSHANGIVGSRSTFSAWGAFLGGVPLLVQPGGNAYRPHAQVWEVSPGGFPSAWHDEVENRQTRNGSL